MKRFQDTSGHQSVIFDSDDYSTSFWEQSAVIKNDLRKRAPPSLVNLLLTWGAARLELIAGPQGEIGRADLALGGGGSKPRVRRCVTADRYLALMLQPTKEQKTSPTKSRSKLSDLGEGAVFPGSCWRDWTAEIVLRACR